MEVFGAMLLASQLGIMAAVSEKFCDIQRYDNGVMMIQQQNEYPDDRDSMLNQYHKAYSAAMDSDRFQLPKGKTCEDLKK